MLRIRAISLTSEKWESIRDRGVVSVSPIMSPIHTKTQTVKTINKDIVTQTNVPVRPWRQNRHSNPKGWQPALLTDEDPVLQAGARDISRPPVEGPPARPPKPMLTQYRLEFLQVKVRFRAPREYALKKVEKVECTHHAWDPPDGVLGGPSDPGPAPKCRAQDREPEKPPRSRHRCKPTRVYLQAGAWVQAHGTRRGRALGAGARGVAAS